MAALQVFSPRGLSSQHITVGVVPVKVVLPIRAGQIWFDNRSTDDLIIEFDALADQDTSYRLPGNYSQPLSHPDGAYVSLRRPDGAADAMVFITPGDGF